MPPLDRREDEHPSGRPVPLEGVLEWGSVVLYVSYMLRGDRHHHNAQDAVEARGQSQSDPDSSDGSGDGARMYFLGLTNGSRSSQERLKFS